MRQMDVSRRISIDDMYLAVAAIRCEDKRIIKKRNEQGWGGSGRCGSCYRSLDNSGRRHCGWVLVGIHTQISDGKPQNICEQHRCVSVLSVDGTGCGWVIIWAEKMRRDGTASHPRRPLIRSTLVLGPCLLGKQGAAFPLTFSLAFLPDASSLPDLGRSHPTRKC